MMRRRNTMKDYIRYGLYALVLLFCFLLQSARGFLPQPFGAAALPVLPAVVCIAMQESDAAGAAYGLFAGLLMDAYSINMAGFNALLLMITGCAVGLLITFLISRNWLSACIITALVLFAYLTAHWLFFTVFTGHERPIYYYLRFQLPSGLYTLLLLPLIYFLTGLIRRHFRPVRMY